MVRYGSWSQLRCLGDGLVGEGIRRCSTHWHTVTCTPDRIGEVGSLVTLAIVAAAQLETFQHATHLPRVALDTVIWDNVTAFGQRYADLRRCHTRTWR